VASSSKQETIVFEIQIYIRTQPKRASIEGHRIFRGRGAAFKILKQSSGIFQEDRVQQKKNVVGGVWIYFGATYV